MTLHVRNYERFFFPHVHRAEIFGGDGETWLPALMVFPRVRRGAPSREIKIDVSICLSILPPIYLSIYLSICIYLHLSVDPPGYPFIYPRSLVHLRLSAGFDAPFRRYLRTRAATWSDILRALNCTLEISHRPPMRRQVAFERKTLLKTRRLKLSRLFFFQFIIFSDASNQSRFKKNKKGKDSDIFKNSIEQTGLYRCIGGINTLQL